MIAPRRPLRLACAAASGAAAGRARVIQPPPLRWRRGRPAVAGRGVPGRLASCIVKLQQHLHFGPVNVQGWRAPTAQAPGPGRPGMPARDRLRARSPVARVGLPGGGRSAVHGQPWTTPAPLARPAPPAVAGPAQAVRAPAPAAGPRVASAGASAANRAPVPRNARDAGDIRLPVGRPGAMARGSSAHATGSAGARAAPHAPALAAVPMRHPMPQRARPGTQRARLPGQPACAPGEAAPRLPSPRAATTTFTAAPPPAMLKWRRHAQVGPSAPGPRQSVQGDVPAPLARYGADRGAAAPAPLSAAGIVPVIAALDSAAADRLAEDVVRRVERRLRIERERRGL